MKREKIQKEPREVERLSCFKGNAGEPCNISCKRWRKGGTISCLSTKKVVKDGTKDTKYPRQEKNYRKNAWRQEKKCGKSEKKLSGRKSASHSCRTKSIRTIWQMRKRKQRLEKKEEVAMHRRRWNAVWKRWWNRFSHWERGQGMCTLKNAPIYFPSLEC